MGKTLLGVWYTVLRKLRGRRCAWCGDHTVLRVCEPCIDTWCARRDADTLLARKVASHVPTFPVADEIRALAYRIKKVSPDSPPAGYFDRDAST